MFLEGCLRPEAPVTLPAHSKGPKVKKIKNIRQKTLLPNSIVLAAEEDLELEWTKKAGNEFTETRTLSIQSEMDLRRRTTLSVWTEDRPGSPFRFASYKHEETCTSFVI